MTIQQQLELIRQKCIEVNPEILKLTFGCQIKERGSIYIDKYIDTGADKETGQDIYHTWYYPDGHFAEWEVVGRPIRLADVLLAHQAIKYETAMTKYYQIASVVEKWNLHKDDLTEQSDECVKFIADLLK